jgi:shikimate dehydrogenase
MNDVAAQKFCVIGDPIGHSLSPLIHRYVFLTLGLNGSYESVLVRPSELRRFVEDAKRSRLQGFNVTIPHKQAVIPLLDRLDSTAGRIGAVNTVQRSGDRLTGYNTDVHGCRSALQRAGYRPAGKAVVLFGAGGAARAAAEALASLGITTLHLIEIDRPRMDRFKTDIESSLGITVMPAASGNGLRSILEGAELIVNATPVGMWPRTDQSPIPDPEWIASSSLVFDMVPNPAETLLLRQAKSRGAAALSGLVMLVAQAIAADEIWLGRLLPETLHADVLTHCLENMEAHGAAQDSHGR